MSFDPVNLLTNTSTLGGDASNGLIMGLAKEFTVGVYVTGSPSSFSIDIEGDHTGDPTYPWATLLNITEPGFYTINTHWVKSIRANLVSLSGGTSPKVSVTAAAPNPQGV